MHPRGLALPTVLAIALAVLASRPAAAIEFGEKAHATRAMPSDLSAQSRRYRRARTRIQVHPRRYYLGPNATRDCVSWLQPERRPSGTVIVPHLRCWWVPG